MRKFFESIGIVNSLVLLNLSIYHFFLKSTVTTWGASPEEVNMPMAGDGEVFTTTSTRAISINASKAEVWKWLIQLGADRGGFYSYSFIERAMGYKTRHQDKILPEFKTLVKGDIVRGSIDEKKCIFPYNFPVASVQTGESFVLDNWGTFLLKAVNNQQTRLIVRTQEVKSSTRDLTAVQYMMVPLHYIMERRMLMGIKARVEAGEGKELSEAKDIAWFSGIVLSGLLICLPIFRGSGIIQRLLFPAIFSNAWLYTLLALEPTPLHSIGLSITGVALMATATLKRAGFSEAQASVSRLAPPLQNNSVPSFDTTPKPKQLPVLNHEAPKQVGPLSQAGFFTQIKAMSPITKSIEAFTKSIRYMK